jgi:excisionase family DNA binding protein
MADSKEDFVEINEDEFYTIDEVAKKLKVHRQTVMARIESGELLSCRFGTLIVRIKKEDFESYVNNSRGV